MRTPAISLPDPSFAAAERRLRAWDHPLAADLLRVLHEVRSIRTDMTDLRQELDDVRAELTAVEAGRQAPLLRVIPGDRAPAALRRAA